MPRKVELANGEVYHIFSKSIAGFKIFNNNDQFLRAKNMLRYYQIEDMSGSFSHFVRQGNVKKDGFSGHFSLVSLKKEKIVQIIAYCFMPTHLHLILKQLRDNGISTFMRLALNSYTRYFNTLAKRKGPLWEGRFQNALVETDEYLLHLTRYIHLNPATGYLVDKPQDWLASSYHEYLKKIGNNGCICEYDGIMNIEPSSYKKFVEDRISYQRELAKIKHLLLE